MSAYAGIPMPKRRVGQALRRLRVRRDRERLDRALAGGQDPWTTAETMLRAATLTALPTRRALAQTIANLIVIAHMPGPVASTIDFWDVQREPIREEHARLSELAFRLHGPAPVSVASIALLATLLWHDADSLRDPSRAADALQDTLDRCFEGIDPAVPVTM